MTALHCQRSSNCSKGHVMRQPTENMAKSCTKTRGLLPVYKVLWSEEPNASLPSAMMVLWKKLSNTLKIPMSARDSTKALQ